jgi:hypothetical protein
VSGTGRLNKPMRAVVAAVELLVAAGLVWLAFWMWPHGIATITDTASDGAVLKSTKYFGNWLAGSIGVGMVAALLVVDAIRQLVLGLRTRPQRRKAEQDPVADELAAANAG